MGVCVGLWVCGCVDVDVLFESQAAGRGGALKASSQTLSWLLDASLWFCVCVCVCVLMSTIVWHESGMGLACI